MVEKKGSAEITIDDKDLFKLMNRYGKENEKNMDIIISRLSEEEE